MTFYNPPLGMYLLRGKGHNSLTILTSAKDDSGRRQAGKNAPWRPHHQYRIYNIQDGPDQLGRRRCGQGGNRLPHGNVGYGSKTKSPTRAGTS